MSIHTGGKTRFRRSSADNKWMILSSTSYLFSAFYDDTKIYVNGNIVDTINKQQIKTISLSANDIVWGDKPISFSRSGSGQTGLCYAFEGTQFAHEWDRYSISFYMVATTKESANVTITYGASTSFWTGTVGTSSYTTVTPSSNGRYIIESDKPIAVYAGNLPSEDCMPLYPCSTELFGTASSGGHIIAVEDNTSITEYSTTGSSTSYTMNRGGYRDITYTGGSQFSGASVRLVADKPIAAESQADGDGGEMTPFIGLDGFGKQFVIPENEREFVKIVSNTATTVRAYNASGTLLSTTTLSGSATNGVYNALLTGTSSYEGVLLIADDPVTAIYEGEDDDETILFAHYPSEIGVHYGSKIVTDGLVLALDAANPKSYPGTGTTWSDLSGNGNDGTLVNGPTYSNDNQGKLIFDGVNDYSDHGDILDMGTSDTTIIFWVRPLSVATSNDWFVSKAAALGQSFRYAFGVSANTNQPRIFFCPQNGIDILALGNTSLSINTWYMLTGIWNRSGNMQIYVNDQAETMSGSTNISAYSSTNMQSANPYRVGAFTASNNSDVFNPFHGDIAQSLHYNKALTEAEIKQNFNATRGRYGI